MITEVIWSDFADSQLDEIYEYYKKEVSPEITTKLVVGIINEPNRLIKTPYIGQGEELLNDRKIKYRYLIYKSYKLIYSVDEENGVIKIADVFDTRQYPPKMRRTK